MSDNNKTMHRHCNNYSYLNTLTVSAAVERNFQNWQQGSNAFWGRWTLHGVFCRNCSRVTLWLCKHYRLEIYLCTTKQKCSTKICVRQAWTDPPRSNHVSIAMHKQKLVEDKTTMHHITTHVHEASMDQPSSVQSCVPCNAWTKTCAPQNYNMPHGTMCVCTK